MQRVEPAKVQADTEPPIPVSRKASDRPVRERTPTMDAQDPPDVEVTPVHVPLESGGLIVWASLFFAAFWVAGIGAYSVGLVGVDRLLTLTNEWYYLIAAVIIVPIVLAILIAVLAREAKIMRRQSTSLAIVASHLAEPEEHAARNLTRLGRAIRRELEVFNTAVETATARMATLEVATNERLSFIERTALAAQERVEIATGKLGAEREKLAQFTQALDTVVLTASQTLTSKLQDARAAARTASESLHAEHGAIAGLISTLQSASHNVSAKALETGKEIERQAQRLDAASEAAAARSEQVVARHERQRAALADTIDRLKQENDHMARALDYQREGMNKLVTSMTDETKKIGTFTMEGARRLDDTAAIMAQRIVETTQLFAREAEKLRTSSELTSSGLEQAMQTIRTAGDSSFDAAGRLGTVLMGLRDTATTASQHIESTVTRLSKMLHELPTEAATQAKNLRLLLDQQAQGMNDLTERLSSAFDRVQAIEMARQQPLQLSAPLPPTHIVQAPQPAHPQLSAAHMPLARQQLPRAPLVHDDAAPSVPHFRVPQLQPGQVPDFNIPPPAQEPVPTYRAQPPPHNARHLPPADNGDQRGWFGLAKRPIRQPLDGQDFPADDRSSWDMKALLAAAEARDVDRRIPQPLPQPPRRGDVRADQGRDRPGQAEPPHPHLLQPPQRQPIQQQLPVHAHSQTGENTAGPQLRQTSARHMIESLQALAIDLSRFLEDDPPADLVRRYRNGERNVFARRLASVLGAEHARLISQKYRDDREFRDTVDRYVQVFEALLEQTSRSDRENVLVETYLTSQTGKVYVTLASAIGRLA